jgi:hypothetical protein
MESSEGEVVKMRFIPRIKPTAALLALLLIVALLAHSPLSAQVTAGTVSGVVQDTTGAVIPNATVVLTDLENNSQRKTVSNGSGAFTFGAVGSSLSLKLKVTEQGFKTWESQPFPLRPGDRFNVEDIKMQIGAISDTVTVETDSQAVKPLDTGERSDIITAKDLQTLAIVGRDATELIRFLPGFQESSGSLNNSPGYNAAVVGLSGPTGSFSANGTGTNGIAVVSDGVSLTDIGSNSGTVQSVNPDMVSEIKVSSAFSAESAKGPEVINAIGKSGTSSFHGEGYMYVRNAALNANDWYNNDLKQTRPDGEYYYPGGQIGGPVRLPWTKWNRSNPKLFFFGAYEYYNQSYQGALLNAVVPTVAQRAGDFSLNSLNAQLCGGRPDGAQNEDSAQPECFGENYLPSGAAVYNGQLQGMGNSNGVALINWLPAPNADPFTNPSGYNYIQEVLQTQNGSRIHAKIDWDPNDFNKFFISYGRQGQITQEPVNFNYVPSNSVEFPGAVTSGDTSNTIAFDYTHIFSSTVTNEVNLAMSYVYDPGNEGNPSRVSRFNMNSYNGGHGNLTFIGEYKNTGDYSVPALQDYSSLGYPNMLMPGGFYNDRVHLKKMVPDAQDTVSWVKGHHFFKFGFYFEKGILNGLADYGTVPQGQLTFNPQNSFYEYNGTPNPAFGGNTPFGTTGFTACEGSDAAGTNRISGAADLGSCFNPNALMYLGFADSYTESNFAPLVDMTYNTVAGFVNDTWKIKRVTLTLGARLEHLGPWTDRHNNGLAEFSNSLYETQCGGETRNCNSLASPGITWHSMNHGVANSVNEPASVYASPRFGFAWDIRGNAKTVLRGGWGVYRAQEEFNPYALASATAQGYQNTYQAGQLSFLLIDEQTPVNPPDYTAYTVSPTDTVRPIHYVYNATISQALPWHSLMEIAYVGSNNQNLSSLTNTSYNSASDINLIPQGALFNAKLVNDDTGVCGQPSDLSNFPCTAAVDFFRPHPFYDHIYQLKHNFYSNYNSMQLSWNKSTGLVQYGANYTFGKNLATAQSFNTALPDPFNLRNDYNPVPYDHSQVFNVHYLIDLGKRYKGGFRPLQYVVNDWQISGISTVQSGADLTSEDGENFGFGYGTIVPTQVPLANQINLSSGAEKTCAQLYSIPRDANGNTYCVTSLNPTVWLGSPDIELMPTLNCNPAGGPAKHQYVKPTCFGIPLPGGGTTGDGQGQYRPPYIHGPVFMDHDLSVLKNFQMHDKRNLQLRLAGFNFLNHPLVSFNANDPRNLTLGGFENGVPGKPLTQQMIPYTYFGIAEIKLGSRLVELSAKYSF